MLLLVRVHWALRLVRARPRRDVACGIVLMICWGNLGRILRLSTRIVMEVEVLYGGKTQVFIARVLVGDGRVSRLLLVCGARHGQDVIEIHAF